MKDRENAIAILPSCCMMYAAKLVNRQDNFEKAEITT